MDAAPREGVRARPGLPSLLLALEFLTVLRLRRAPAVEAEQVARALLWYPLVGLLLGLALAGCDRLLLPHLAAGPEAALLLLLLEGVTGFLHLDGLADSADGLLGLHERGSRLEIMRDSRSGAFGVTAIGFYLLIAWSALASLSGPGRTAVLIATPLCSRAALVIVGYFPNARPGGLAEGFTSAARGWCGALALSFAAAVALLVLGAGGLALLAVASLAALLTGAFATQRIGGVTGDVFGAGCQIAQAVVLLFASAGQGWLRPWL
jgi:adenosylcobinamide-GDP ribazoletransferase